MTSARIIALLAALLPSLAHAADYCDERPTASPSRSIGSPSHGELRGGVGLADGKAVRILPKRHKARCLNWGTAHLVAALERAGAAVQKAMPNSPALGVGDLSRARGGAIDYSHSHQCGRDADLAFYLVDAEGRPVPAEDLVRVGKDLRTADGRRFDIVRNWLMVKALLTDPAIEVRWMFVSQSLRAALLEEAQRRGEPKALRNRAAQLLHQPRDAREHDDHLHLRIACSADDKQHGCRD